MSKLVNFECLLLTNAIFSVLGYLLSRAEGRVGSPERPLSDHGLLVYQRYWRWQVVSFLRTYAQKVINLKGEYKLIHL